jgi:GntR family transcriptional regulator, transcriptional repressor for pyruvate dehydrogenase complex
MTMMNTPSGSQTSEGTPRLRYELVASKMMQLITTTGLKTGDRLPTERTLSEQLGVSRAVIREAVSFLSAKGIVRSLQGSGLYVASEPSTFFAPPFLNLSTSVDPKDVESLFEYRLGIETTTARFAAERITPKELLLLQETALLYKQGAEANQLELASHSDTDFHRIIAEATRNPFFISTVTGIFRLQDWVTAVTVGGVIGSLLIAAQQHEDIFTAIQSGRSEDAARAMQTHIETTQTNYYQAARKRLIGDEPLDSSSAY